jgi:hypothetical protein
MNEKYQAEIIIKSEWIENSDLTVYDPARHWNPQLFIENQLSATKENITYSVTKRNGFNLVTETRQVKGGSFSLNSTEII